MKTPRERLRERLGTLEDTTVDKQRKRAEKAEARVRELEVQSNEAYRQSTADRRSAYNNGFENGYTRGCQDTVSPAERAVLDWLWSASQHGGVPFRTGDVFTPTFRDEVNAMLAARREKEGA